MSSRGGDGLPAKIIDLSKLRIENGIIHYRLYQQDGTSQPMTCADTVENRNFVSWVQIHDRSVGRLDWKSLEKIS